MKIDNSQSTKWTYQSSQTHMSVVNGKKTVTTEIVTANDKGGKKTVKKNGSTKTIPLTSDEVQNIKERKFMPDFFQPCYDGLCLADKAVNVHSEFKETKTKTKTKKVKKN